jgi:uncharacterized protein (TIGR02246 family)
MNAQATQTKEAALDAIAGCRDAHIAAVNSGDVEAWAALFTDDGVQMPPRFPSNVGRDAIEAWTKGFMAPFDVSFALPPSDVQVTSPDWALEAGTWEIALTPKAGGEQIRDAGKYVTIYKRQPDDTWAMSHDIWNSSNPPPGMP